LELEAQRLSLQATQGKLSRRPCLLPIDARLSSLSSPSLKYKIVNKEDMIWFTIYVKDKFKNIDDVLNGLKCSSLCAPIVAVTTRNWTGY
jgi:hypothetical protein